VAWRRIRREALVAGAGPQRIPHRIGAGPARDGGVGRQAGPAFPAYCGDPHHRPGIAMAAHDSLTQQLRHTVGRSWWVILLFGILSTLFGVMALVNPVATAASLTWAIGVLAVAEGAVGLVGAFNKDAGVSRGWMVFYALVSLVFGGMAIANPVSMAASIVMVAAVWFIVSGVLRIVFAVRVRKEIDHEWMLILGGVLGVVLGGLMLAAPVAGLIVGVVWIGAGALLYGVLQIVAAFKVRKLAA
jgi:uncharacterized membrane protein HdeD (DUF308 family)